MKKKLMQYLPFVLLLFPILLSFIPWYQNVAVPSSTYLNQKTLGYLRGIDAFMIKSCRILLIYFFCLVIQYMAICKKIYISSVISNFILIVILTLFPTYYWPIKYMKLFFIQTFYIGYFIAVIFILLSIILDFIFHFTSKRKGVIKFKKLIY